MSLQREIKLFLNRISVEPIFVTAFLFFLLFQPSLFAQKNNIFLYGKIDNSKNDTLVLSNHYGKYFAITDQTGMYKFDLSIKDPDFFNFKIGNNQITLLLVACDTLELNVDNQNFKNSIVLKGNKSELNKKLIGVSRGNRAPNFAFKNVKGELISIEDFKGKYVYIDVWNSACKPCFKEFPMMEELVEKYEGKDIVFLGVSLDRNEETWKKTLTKRGLKGIQLFGGGWKSDFVRDYSIVFNPRFILIDKEQKILYLSAPRPSGEIDEILSELE